MKVKFVGSLIEFIALRFTSWNLLRSKSICNFGKEWTMVHQVFSVGKASYMIPCLALLDSLLARAEKVAYMSIFDWRWKFLIAQWIGMSVFDLARTLHILGDDVVGIYQWRAFEDLRENRRIARGRAIKRWRTEWAHWAGNIEQVW